MKPLPQKQTGSGLRLVSLGWYVVIYLIKMKKSEIAINKNDFRNQPK